MLSLLRIGERCKQISAQHAIFLNCIILLLVCLMINVWHLGWLSFASMSNTIAICMTILFSKPYQLEQPLCTNSSDSMPFYKAKINSSLRISKQRQKYQPHRLFKLVLDDNRLQNWTQHIEQPYARLLNFIFNAYRSDLQRNWY